MEGYTAFKKQEFNTKINQSVTFIQLFRTKDDKKSNTDFENEIYRAPSNEFMLILTNAAGCLEYASYLTSCNRRELDASKISIDEKSLRPIYDDDTVVYEAHTNHMINDAALNLLRDNDKECFVDSPNDDIKPQLRPLDIVRTPGGGVALVKEVSVSLLRKGGRGQTVSIVYLNDCNPLHEYNSWWDWDDLILLDNIPRLLSNIMAHPFGDSKSQGDKYYPLNINMKG